MKLAQKILIILLLSTISIKPAFAASPVGFLDGAKQDVVYGWAKDDDFTGPILVHIYIDGVFTKQVTANGYRTDIGNHGFAWHDVPILSPGNHTIQAYGLGVDASGTLDNQNPELSLSPKTLSIPNLYSLKSSDNQIEITFDPKFGGAITYIQDKQNLPGKNLVNDSQGGAMFQSALWLTPKHIELPPRCAEIGHTGGDAWYENPTQAGFVADGLAGNPIGELGFGSGLSDDKEFIRYENSGKLVHFKTRYVRYDYCKAGTTPLSDRNLWDTNFYLEQWAFFSENYPNTLVLKSKLTYDGDGSREVLNGGGLQIIFGFHTPRVTYQKNNTTVIDNCYTQICTNRIPDNNWAATINDTINAGIGMVIDPNGRSDVNESIFNVEIRGNSGVSSMDTSAFYPLGAGPVWQTVGQMVNVTERLEPHPINGNNQHHYTMNNTSSFSWDMYFPIGTTNHIQTQANSILSTAYLSPTPTPSTPNPFDIHPATPDGDLDLLDYLTWAQQIKHKISNIFAINQFIQYF